MTRSSDLALYGGPPAISSPDLGGEPRLGNVLIDDAESEAARRVVRSGKMWRYQGGREVERFEDAVSSWLGLELPGLALNSGTSALLMAMASIAGETKIKRIGIPSVGFVSCALAAVAAGFEAVLLEVDSSLSIDVDRLDDSLNSGAELGAILAVHPYGEPCDIERLCRVAARHSVVVVEDVAQCLGGQVAGAALGTFGQVAAFSFQTYKLLSTGEGGMLVGSDPKTMDLARVLHDGAAPWTLPDLFERTSELPVAPLNLRMSEIEAAIGLVQLERVSSSLELLRRRARVIEDLIVSSDVTLRPRAHGCGISSHVMVYELSEGAARWFCEALCAEGALASRFLPAKGSNRHWAGAWNDVLVRCGAAPLAEEVRRREVAFMSRLICLPLDLGHTDEQFEQLVVAVGKVLATRDRGSRRE